jgi:protein-S-isoprenylcysteine O-methyltransferase Ste14
MNAFSMCGYIWAAWVITWMMWAFQSKTTKQAETLGSRFSYTLIVWAAGYLVFSRRFIAAFLQHPLFPPQPWIGWLGVAITVVGFAVTLWARFILGSNWSGTVTIKVDHELIRTGPYNYVRHPIYTGIIVALMGTVLALDQWRGVFAVVLLWIGFTIKRLKEEQFMRQTFGDQYTAYSETTGAIFPTLVRRSS